MIHDPTTLLALAARAEAGGDEALSDDVWIKALGWTKEEGRGVWFGWCDPAGVPIYVPQERPDFRTSIDAQEAALPGRIVEVTTEDDGTISAAAAFNGIVCYGEAIGDEAEKRARLAARLRAMAAAAQREETKE